MPDSLHHIFTVFLDNVKTELSPLDVLAVVTSFLSVWLAMRNRISTWGWGILSSLAYAWLFWQQKNYANLWLFLAYFVPTEILGWWMWLRFGPHHNDDLPVTVMTARSRVLFAAALLPLWGLSYFVLVKYTDDPYPLMDGFTAALSIVAQYLQMQKKIENWILWVIADVAYAFYLFPIQKDYLSTLLYVVFLWMGVQGFRDWLRLLRAPASSMEPAESAAP